MDNPAFSGPDGARSRLRAAVATLEGEIARLPKTTTDGGNLLASFDDLVKQLALGPDSEVRPCPHCKKVGMRAATLCSHCWTKLTPPVDTAPKAVAP